MVDGLFVVLCFNIIVIALSVREFTLAIHSKRKGRSSLLAIIIAMSLVAMSSIIILTSIYCGIQNENIKWSFFVFLVVAFLSHTAVALFPGVFLPGFIKRGNNSLCLKISDYMIPSLRYKALVLMPSFVYLFFAIQFVYKWLGEKG